MPNKEKLLALVGNRELTSAQADALWEEMDDTGHARWLGSDKLKATRLVREAHQRVCQEGEQASNLVVGGERQFPLISMSPSEKREVARIATNQRQRPDGTFRRLMPPSSADQIVGARDSRYARWLAGRASAGR